MTNPWKKIDLDAYEIHMKSENVMQLQTLSQITKEQIKAYNHNRIAILGIAGGNGLEHIDPSLTSNIFGVDINPKYLKICQDRYPELDGKFIPICIDLNQDELNLVNIDLLICNLIIEYLGVKRFAELIRGIKYDIKFLSCVIQKNKNSSFVSHSEAALKLEPLESVHVEINENLLENEMSKVGLRCIKKETYSLPNGKEFIRMDFSQKLNFS